jgi:hypothetical protein
MLTEIFGLEWFKVHDEAEQLEHAVSADFEQKLIEKLGSGDACPHGKHCRHGLSRPAAQPRPEDPGGSHAREHLTIASVFERDRKLLEYLDGQGIRPGTRWTSSPPAKKSSCAPTESAARGTAGCGENLGEASDSAIRSRYLTRGVRRAGLPAARMGCPTYSDFE